jgi:hypothetical protein
MIAHVHNELTTDEIQKLENRLASGNGVKKVEIRKTTRHALFVFYDSFKTTSKEIHETIRNLGFKTNLVGM